MDKIINRFDIQMRLCMIDVIFFLNKLIFIHEVVIWNKVNEQHQHQKSAISNGKLVLFGGNKVKM